MVKAKNSLGDPDFLSNIFRKNVSAFSSPHECLTKLPERHVQVRK